MAKTHLIQAGYPCDGCGCTSDDLEAGHVSCDFCQFIGCRDCCEEHVFVEHENEIDVEEPEDVVFDDYEEDEF